MANASAKPASKRVAGRVLNTLVHPEMMKRIKVTAIEEDVNIIEVLHRLLCGAFDRTDLIAEVPEASKATEFTG